MSQVDIKAREYCEKNIPSQPQMHLAISTAFEAGWEAAMNSVVLQNQRKKTREFYMSVQSMRTMQTHYEEDMNDDKRFKLKALAEYQVDRELDRVNEILKKRGEELIQ